MTGPSRTSSAANLREKVTCGSAAVGLVRWYRLREYSAQPACAQAACVLLLWGVIGVLAAAGGTAWGEETAGADGRIDFNRDVRPVLADHCFQCHGPDAASREAELRLDHREGLLGTTASGRLVVAGEPDNSLLYQRISAQDPAERMPPPESGRELTAEQIRVLRKWITQGAQWESHWSFAPLRSSTPPRDPSGWSRNAIDQFVVRRLREAKLAPAREATREVLIRRVTLDLTGLPPTPPEVAAFVGDSAPDAYERVVDRLLASPAYGEQMALPWLDAARYADTHGYQNDGDREMWRWRDWVIAAYNRNLPFDQFTIQQLAGDLLPNAGLAERIATGFNRNHRYNSEGGSIQEEFLVENVVDRVDTTAAVWLGLTLGCARCHDHKYDPFTQRDYYQLFAYFHNVPETGRAIRDGNSEPYLVAPTQLQQVRLAELDAEIAVRRAAWNALEEKLAAAQRRWEQQVAAEQQVGGEQDRGEQDRGEQSADARVSEGDSSSEYQQRLVLRGLQALYPFEATMTPIEPSDWRAGSIRAPSAQGPVAERAANQPAKKADGQAFRRARGARRAAERDGPQYGPGSFGTGLRLTGRPVALATRVGDKSVGDFQNQKRYSIAVWVKPEQLGSAMVLSRMDTDTERRGYALYWRDGRVHFTSVSRWIAGVIGVATRQTWDQSRWYHLAVTYDGSMSARGIRLYVDGVPQDCELTYNSDSNPGQVSKRPLTLGAGPFFADPAVGWLDQLRLYERVLSPQEIAQLAEAAAVPALAQSSPEQRSPRQREKLRNAFLNSVADDWIQTPRAELQAAIAARAAYHRQLPTVMVMQELPEPRPTHILIRGQYDQKGERVAPGVPRALPPLPADAAPNRLGLARWMVDRRNPLTPRVAVNRIWQHHFGVGLVKTAEDFGSQGELPQNPELFDWLAAEFQRTWDVKALHRLIVTSATYRQSSRVTAELMARDPENRLLARGPRVRLSAHAIRDQALAAAGILVRRLGGPSVKPYQPPGLWSEVSRKTYRPDQGEGLYRRSLYTYWKRTVAPPGLATFDAADRESCRLRTDTTNTPLQALTLMNETGFVEAARLLAQRMLTEAGSARHAQIAFAFRALLARGPDREELRRLEDAYASYRRAFARDPQAARQLIAAGASPVRQGLDPVELAAATAVASVLFNLDETITRE